MGKAYIWCKKCRQNNSGHDRLGGYCYICGHDIELAGRVPEIKVVRLGQFAGGSFGTAGNPSKVYEMWAVTGPFNAGAFSAPAYTFTSKAAADECAVAEHKKAREEADGRMLDLGYDRVAEEEAARDAKRKTRR